MKPNTPPKRSLCSLIRDALKNRYDFPKVTIDGSGDIVAIVDLGYGKTSKITYGNIRDWSWKRTPSMNIQMIRSGSVIFTFSPDN